MSLLKAAVAWASSSGPPNWVFVVALLTTPARWSSTAVAFARSRLGSDVDGELQEDVKDG